MSCIGLIEFGRTPGAKDKKKRKSRVSDIGLGAAGFGAVSLGSVSNRLGSKVDDAGYDLLDARMRQGRNHTQNKELWQELNKRYKGDRARTKDAFTAIQDAKIEDLNRKIPTSNPLNTNKDVTKFKNKRVTDAGRAYKKVLKTRNIARAGAVGLAGLSALELGRRGINKYRNRARGDG